MAATNPTQLPKRVKDETGKRYGKLTVLEYVPNRGHGAHWRCRCDCGNVVVVYGAYLRRGNNKSCSQKCGVTKHGGTADGIRSAEYSCWRDMQSRCENPRYLNYCNYGARGISVCDRWRGSFQAFIDDMGPRPGKGYSLDRIDNDGNYEPSNCRWATKREQDNNRRTNRLLTHRGQTKSLTEWAREFGINPLTVHHRLQRGWDLHRALTAPVS